jgi:hypothetical protein
VHLKQQVDSSNNWEATMDANEVANLSIPTNFTIGSFTTGNYQAPRGEVMKLDIPNLPEAGAATADDAAMFGTHIREAIAIVKDWTKRP